MEEIGQRKSREKEREGVPYPGYFAKCAEAIDSKRVGGNSWFQVCGKCAEGVGRKAVRGRTVQSRRLRAGLWLVLHEEYYHVGTASVKRLIGSG
jgi:hypothetical protein